MFGLVENRLFADADDSTLLAVVCKPADTPAVATSLNRNLAMIQEWCNHWCMIQNPNKTKTLVVHNLDILGVKSYSKLTFEDHERVLFPVSLRKLVN